MLYRAYISVHAQAQGFYPVFFIDSLFSWFILLPGENRHITDREDDKYGRAEK